MRIARMTLRPQIVRGPASEQRVRGFVEVAHREYFISSSLTTEIDIEPTIEIRA